MAGTTTGFVCDVCNFSFTTSEMREEHFSDGHEIVLSRVPAPCKHEWRQYMERAGDVARFQGERRGGPWEHNLVPDGFFCIHCTERRD